MFRFSTKIQQLKESGLIDHWIAVEQDKVARVVKAGPATRDPVGLSVTNLQVSMEGWRAALLDLQTLKILL